MTTITRTGRWLLRDLGDVGRQAWRLWARHPDMLRHALLASAAVTLAAIIAPDWTALFAVTGWLATVPSRHLLRMRWNAAWRVHDMTTPKLAIGTIRHVPMGRKAMILTPPGFSVDQIAERAPQLAADLRAIAIRVDRDPYNARRGELTVIEREPFIPAGAPGGSLRWPTVAKVAQCSLWDPLPIGVNEDLDPVQILLPEQSLLLGGIPGAGKSVAIHQIVATAALDPGLPELWLFDGKRVELSPWRDSAVIFVDYDIDRAVMAMEKLVAEIHARLERLDNAQAWRRKVARGEERLLLAVVDELATFARHPDKKAGDRFTELYRHVIERGRAAGICNVAAAQKPSSYTVPTDLRDLFSLRWAMRCTTNAMSDTILGQGTAADGYSAADIAEAQRGVGYLLAETHRARLVKAYHLTDDDVTELARSAAALRKAPKAA
jgi:hypothetical protein